MSLQTVTPSACAYCGVPEREHYQRWSSPYGWHSYTAPDQDLILRRMRLRQTLRPGGTP